MTFNLHQLIQNSLISFALKVLKSYPQQQLCQIKQFTVQMFNQNIIKFLLSLEKKNILYIFFPWNKTIKIPKERHWVLYQREYL